MSDRLEACLSQIHADFPALIIASARLNSDGMVNDVVIINEDLIFRFAKNEQAQALLNYEVQILEIVARGVSLPVPRILHRTEHYVHYQIVPGVPLYRHLLLRCDPAIQDRLAGELAMFLRQLHAISLDKLPAPPERTAASAVSRRHAYEQRLAQLQQDVYPLLWADQKAWIEDLFVPVLNGSLNLDRFTPQLVHRDLASYHILHEPRASHLTGVIDFGTAGAGDVAIDWACLINVYGEQFVQRMHQSYPVDQGTLDRSRFLAGALELEWALAGVKDTDVSLLLVHLGRARDSLPIGSPWPSATLLGL